MAVAATTRIRLPGAVSLAAAVLALAAALAATGFAAQRPAASGGDGAPLLRESDPRASQPNGAYAPTAPLLCADEQATVASRPGEPRPGGSARGLWAAPAAPRPALAAARAGAQRIGRVARGGEALWCLAHATSTQAP